MKISYHILSQVTMIIYLIKLCPCMIKVKVCNCYNLIRFSKEFIRMINYLMKEYEVKDLKKPKFCLGLQIKYFQVAC